MTTATHTASSILTDHGYTDTAQEYPDLHIPILTGTQRQGDVLVLAIDGTPPGLDTAQPIGRGIEVVRSEAGANTHTLHGAGRWLPNSRAVDPGVLTQGWLQVPDGAEAYLIHTEEHSALGIGPGVYEVRRQREFAGEWRRVAD